jgi:hypothetical protein
MLAHTRFSNPEKINVYMMGIERINVTNIFLFGHSPSGDFYRIPNFSINHIVRFLSLGKVILNKNKISLARSICFRSLFKYSNHNILVCVFFSPLYENWISKCILFYFFESFSCCFWVRVIYFQTIARIQ